MSKVINQNDSSNKESELNGTEKQPAKVLPKRNIRHEKFEVSLMEENNIYFPNNSNDLDSLFSQKETIINHLLT